MVSTQILGEATEDARNNLIAKEENDEFMLVLKGTRNTENEELFARSSIAVARSSMSSEDILSRILAEGVISLTIKPMGGLLHLISFESVEEKEALLESKWLDNWFMDIRNVNSSVSSQWRETWIKIYGVPISAWNYENFHKIGSVYGRVLTVEYSNFDCATVLVITDCLFKINCKLHLELDGNFFAIFTTENDYCTSVKPDVHGSKGKPNENPSGKVDDGSHANSPSFQSSENHDVLLPPTNTNEASQPMNFSQGDVHSPSKPIKTPTHMPNHVSKIKQIPTFHLPTNQSHPTNSFVSPCPKSLPETWSPPPLPMSNKLNKRRFSVGPQEVPESTPFHVPQAQSHTSNSPPPQIQVSNRFEPLKKHASKQLSTSSSTVSGPTFPPGFEPFIPNPMKLAHEAKRKKKLRKKKQKPKIIPKPAPQQNVKNLKTKPRKRLFMDAASITPDDVLLFAEKIGLAYAGSPAELRDKVEVILERQKADWLNNQL